MLSEIDYKRLCWHSRRGMLELDLLLVPFVEEHFKDLSAENQLHYKELLDSEDQDLFSWLLGREIPEDEQMCRIVDIVLSSRDPAS